MARADTSRDSSRKSGTVPARSLDDERIEVFGAREHNLKIDHLEIPKKKLVVFTGVSGSGKSSMAFDTLFAEGQRRYIESLSAYARQFLGQLERPHVEKLKGLSPTIAIEQRQAREFSGNHVEHPFQQHARDRRGLARSRQHARQVGYGLELPLGDGLHELHRG